MRRREFIGVLGGAAAWPIVAHAQQPGKVARIGFLGSASASAYARQVEGFRSGLRDLSYIEGSNIVIVYRWAEDRRQDSQGRKSRRSSDRAGHKIQVCS
jgi:putative tryptophan/tyrosine transport system substrate-binding protein